MSSRTPSGPDTSSMNASTSVISSVTDGPVSRAMLLLRRCAGADGFCGAAEPRGEPPPPNSFCACTAAVRFVYVAIVSSSSSIVGCGEARAGPCLPTPTQRPMMTYTMS